jgi:hypothetical protein
MIEETQKYFFKLIENIINKTMHDIISPITAIMNSSSILSSRKDNTARYLYGVNSSKSSIPNEQFINDWRKIFYKNEIGINLLNQNISIDGSKIQLISHLIFFFKQNLKSEKNIRIQISENNFEIQFELNNQKEFENQFQRIIEDKEKDIDPMNTNLYFLKSLISINKTKLMQIKNKVICQIAQSSGQCE